MGDENPTIDPGARANPLFTGYDEFGIHPERGFLPAPDPLELLPEDFSPWDRAARELPKLLITGKVSPRRTKITQVRRKRRTAEFTPILFRDLRNAAAH
jgi:hypothetical protein